eukprot:767603-Hanusia_phi.AAC.10
MLLQRRRFQVKLVVQNHRASGSHQALCFLALSPEPKRCEIFQEKNARVDRERGRDDTGKDNFDSGEGSKGGLCELMGAVTGRATAWRSLADVDASREVGE